MSESVTPHQWAERLRAQGPLPPDSRFPDRPRSGFFDLLSRIMRAMDGVADESEEVTPMMTLVGVEPEEVTYMAVQRALHMLKAQPRSARLYGEMIASLRMREDVLAMISAAWTDAFVAGALYGNQNPVIGRVTLDETAREK